eukprot:1159727-Pelagomonas_calceolata.AAC.9
MLGRLMRSAALHRCSSFFDAAAVVVVRSSCLASFADGKLMVVERFLRLRARLPQEELAKYSRQEHLNETDSQLLAQSLAEMVCVCVRGGEGDAKLPKELCCKLVLRAHIFILHHAQNVSLVLLHTDDCTCATLFKLLPIDCCHHDKQTFCQLRKYHTSILIQVSPIPKA